MHEGLISKIFSWVTSASYDKTTTKEWAMGLAFILIVAFLWATVIRQVVEPAAETIGSAVEGAIS